MYTDEKIVLKNHCLNAAKRLMSHGDVEGNAEHAVSLMGTAVWLDGVKTTERPPAIPKPVKK